MLRAVLGAFSVDGAVNMSVHRACREGAAVDFVEVVMEILLLIVLVVTVILGMLWWSERTRAANALWDAGAAGERATKAEAQLAALRDRFAGVLVVEEEVERVQAELQQVAQQTARGKKVWAELSSQVDALQKKVALLEEHEDLLDLGVYEPHYDFDTSEQYRRALQAINDRIKAVIKSGQATHCPTNWQVGGSYKEGEKMVKKYSGLMLRAFNGECDAAIARVNWSNVVQMEARIEKAWEAINKAGESMQISITEHYFELKMQELHLEHELEERKQQEKEEQRALREQMKEEEKALREAERERRRAEEDEERSRRSLDAARQELAHVHGAAQQKLMERIAQMEQALADAASRKERAISMAQQTRAGHVYIISNIGSFGDNIFKIGMTRRLEPLERVKELGDASVPFEFDVHGLVYSDDAPAMESRLHQAFSHRRLNLVNERREFFHVTLEEIEQVAQRLGWKFELTKIAQAREFRESEARRAQQAPVKPVPRAAARQAALH